MKIQYQVSNGAWIDCNERADRFLTMCETFNGIDADGKICPAFRATHLLTRDEVVAALSTGRKLRNDASDWYSNCRDGEACERKMAERIATAPPIKMVLCSCGHTIPSGSVMSASLGSSCPDCYDRLSM